MRTISSELRKRQRRTEGGKRDQHWEWRATRHAAHLQSFDFLFIFILQLNSVSILLQVPK